MTYEMSMTNRPPNMVSSRIWRSVMFGQTARFGKIQKIVTKDSRQKNADVHKCFVLVDVLLTLDRHQVSTFDIFGQKA